MNLPFTPQDQNFDSEYYRFMAENTTDMIARLDPDGTYRYVSPVSHALLGYAPEELIGRVSYDLFHPEDLELIRRTNGFAAQPGSTHTNWYRVRRRDTTYIWVETTSRYVYDPRLGKTAEIISVSRDVTERKRWESERQESLNALAKARDLESEIGARIQQSLLVPEPFLKSSWVTVGTLALSSSKVDGDYYDFFHCNDTCFDLIIGDVMGKGVPAALLAAATKSHFQRASHRLLLEFAPFSRLPEPQEVVTVVHARMTPELIRLSSFVTLCYTRFDRQLNQLTLVDCGHTRTLHYHRAENYCESLKGDNLPLGLDENEIIRPITRSFAPGDLLVFFSDGVTEAEDAAGELFGDARLTGLVQECAHRSPQEVTEAIRAAVLAFTGNEEVSDDLTCVVVRIEDVPVQSPLTKAALEVRSSVENLESVRDFIQHFLDDAPVPELAETDTDGVILAINEAVCNIHDHAYRGFSDTLLQVVAESYTDRFVFHLYDFGIIFDPTKVSEPSFDGSRDRGFGVFIIQAAMDEADYSRDDLGRNCLTLVKYR